MSDELVEALALRLGAIWIFQVNQHHQETNPSDPIKDRYHVTENILIGMRPVAAECLRQMEWVRSECYDCVGGAAEDTGERISDLKLALAPPEWKP